MSAKVTKTQAKLALEEVARQLGQLSGQGSPTPTGPEAARHGLGPELDMTWNWSGTPTPTILLEGGAFSDWAVMIDVSRVNAAAGVMAEAWSGYALQLFPRYIVEPAAPAPTS